MFSSVARLACLLRKAWPFALIKKMYDFTGGVRIIVDRSAFWPAAVFVKYEP